MIEKRLPPFPDMIGPDPDFRFIEQDAPGPMMRDLISTDPEKYNHTPVVILGCPQDDGVRRNRGRPGARHGPVTIRHELYLTPAPRGIPVAGIFDLGDVVPGETLEETHDRHFSVVQRLLHDDKRVIVLGGGNDISYPDCAALVSVSKVVGAVNIDSHYDVRDRDVRNSGTPYRQLLEEGLIEPQHFWEMGSKAEQNADEHGRYLERIGANVYPLEVVRRMTIDEVMQRILDSTEPDAFFWGFDVDAVRQEDAPGVSAPHPRGLSSEEICHIAEIAGSDLRSRVLEISEVNPVHDVDNRTARLAALIVGHFLTAWLARRSEPNPRTGPS
jgi:formiminoglutamase